MPNDGEVIERSINDFQKVQAHMKNAKKENAKEAPDESFEKGRIAGLQEAILAIMEKNGPVTEQMKRDVRNNVYHDSLITWIKSFR